MENNVKKEENDKIEERKEKITNWLKNPYNLILIGILVFALAIRLYYFSFTAEQALWWDEASYGSIAKNMITHQWDNAQVLEREFIIRAPMLPLLWSLLLRIGFTEIPIRFILLLIPSFFSVLLIYLICKELSNKKIALISSFIFSLLWIHLFYSFRLLTEIPALFLSLLSIYFFTKSYQNNLKLLPFILSIFFLSLSVLARYPFGLIGFIYLLFIVFTKLDYFKKKSFWLGGFIGAFPLILFFIYNFITKGSLFPAASDYTSGFAQIKSFAFYVLNFIPLYLKTAFFIFFVIGVLFCLYELFVGFGTIKKSQKLTGHLFMFLILILTLIFFIFITKAAEDRYLLIAVISFIYFSAAGMANLSEIISKYSKISAIIFLLFVLIFGAYQQIQFGDPLIKQKAESFSQMKEAFLWLKDNFQGNNVVVAMYSEFYSLYYADILPISISDNETEFINQINSAKPAYFVFHIFNSQPPFLYDYLQKHQGEFKLEKYWLLDQQNPAVIIYKIQ